MWMLAACIARRVVGAVLLVSGVCVKFAESSNQWEASADTWRTVPTPKPCWPLRSKETWTKCTFLTLLSQRKIAFTLRETLFALYHWTGAPTKFKNWLRPLFRPRTDHDCRQKPNPSRETVPLNFIFCAVENPRGRRQCWLAWVEE